MQSSSASNDDHTNSVPDSAKEAATKFIVPKTRPQSSSPSNNDHTNGLPDSAEEAAPCTATYSKSSMPSSGKLSYHSSDDLVGYPIKLSTINFISIRDLFINTFFFLVARWMIGLHLKVISL